MTDAGRTLHADFERLLSKQIRELLSQHGYVPMMLVGVSDRLPVWIGLNPDIASREQYRQLVEKTITDLVLELGLMAFLDGLE